MVDEDWFGHDAMTTWGFAWFIRGVLSDARRVLKNGAHLYVFTDWRQTPNLYGMLESCGYRVNQCLVWAKTHFGMGAYWRNQHENVVFASYGMPTPMLDRGMGSVLSAPVVPNDKRVHPTEKPVALIGRILRAAPGRRILDPFVGSGTTLRAAKDCGLEAVGIEIEERYCEVAAKRLEQAVLPFAAAPTGEGEASTTQATFDGF
jgi:site-specific DNA-methyltransferase (adenine-specific)